MKKARGKPSLLRVDEIVVIKIYKVDTTSPLHPNVLIGKILHIENNYTKVVTIKPWNNFQIYYHQSLKQMCHYK